MNRFLSMSISMLVMLSLSRPFFVQGADFGASAARANTAPTIEEMLKYAIQDEYLARAEYDLIIHQFGVSRPFSNIIRSEETHINLLIGVYKQRNMNIPEDEASHYVQLPESLHDAFATGVQAEVNNIAMYQSFLDDPILADSDNADVKDVFTRLMNASKNHLSAFQRGLSRYE